MPPEEVRTTPVGGRYELRELLGRGGMGSVWRGRDLLLERPVAVKRVELPLNLPPADRDALRERVLREARAAARVSHPRLVTIYDVVEEEGTVFLVQELVDVPTLKALVNDSGPLTPGAAARIGRALVDGLAAAHRNGVVHRDVKPANVMVLPDGGAKLADFGIASMHGDPQLTATGVVVGSPSYMAPEQAIGERVGPEADLWSLGATLYWAVEAEAPFGKGETLATLAAVVNEPPRPTVRAGALRPVLDALLQKDPALRPPAERLAPMLDAVIAGGSAPTERVVEVAGPATTVAAPAVATSVMRSGRQHASPDPIQQPERITKRDGGPAPAGGRWVAVAIVLVVLALVAGLGLAAAASKRSSTKDAATTGTTAAPTSAPAKATTTTTAKAATSTTAAPAAGVPAGWATYTDPDIGYVAAYPDGWKVQDRSGNLTDFTDPASGTYLRVDWTDKPGDDAVKAWQDQSATFAKKKSDYREIQITRTTYQGHPAALWEYTYTEGGAQLHAYDLGFTIGDSYGMALNFQTKEDQWAASQPTWQQLQAAFQPPGD